MPLEVGRVDEVSVDPLAGPILGPVYDVRMIFPTRRSRLAALNR